MRTLVVLVRLTLVLAALPACGLLEPEGWQSTRWGMTEHDVRRVVGRFSPGACPAGKYGPEAKICIDRYLLEKRVYFVTLHFDSETNGLYMVRVRSGIEDDEFSNLVVAGLKQKYGNDANCLPRDRPAGDLDNPRLDLCFEWSASRNIIHFHQYTQKQKDRDQESWHIITYSRGPVVVVERL